MKPLVICQLLTILLFCQNIHGQRKWDSDSLNYYLKTIKEDTISANMLTELALTIQHKMDSSILLADSAIVLSKKLDYTRGIVDATLAKGLVYALNGKTGIAEPILNQVLPLCLNLKDNHKLSRVYYGLGICANQHDSLSKAADLLLNAAGYSSKTDKWKFTADIYNQLSAVYISLGKLDLAVNSSLSAIRNYELAQDTMNLSMAYNNLAINFKNLEKYNDAIRYFQLALETARPSGNKRRIANRLANLGSVYVLNKNYDKARHALFEALELSNDSALRGIRSNTLRYLGWLYAALNDNDSALYYSQLSYNIAEEDNDVRMMVHTGLHIGGLFLNLGKTNDALSMLNLTLERAVETGLVPEQMNTYEMLERVYVKKNDFQKAYRYLKLHLNLKDSILNVEKINEAEELKTQYETEKKDQQIVLLHKDKQLQQSEIKRQNTIKNFTFAGSGILMLFATISFVLYKRKRDSDVKLREAEFSRRVSDVEMKALLAQMNPHFIFNSLRSINDFIQRNKTSLASEYLIKFSKLMRAILENSRKKEIVLSDEIEMLKLYMELESQRMEHPFEYQFEIDTSLEVDNAMIPPMLFQPIVENAIWHGLAPMNKQGKIFIRIKKENEMIICEVEDDGVGRVASGAVQTIDSLKSTSYGLKITEERLGIIQQLKKVNSSMHLADLKNGLKVSFMLPLEYSV